VVSELNTTKNVVKKNDFIFFVFLIINGS
jgi:hypothetical protein